MHCLVPAELSEVKIQVADLLERGLVEPSTSAHCMLLLLTLSLFPMTVDKHAVAVLMN